VADAAAGVNAGRLEEWFRAHIPGIAPPLSFEIIPGGHSNLTYRVTDSQGRRSVLRRPPLGAVLATAHDMAREHRIVSALAGSAVPVPPILGLCRDESVNGAPFYVMDFVEGVVLDESATAERLLPQPQRAGLGFDVIEVLAKLHAVDADAVGVGDLGRRGDYLKRQLKRWRTQWENSKTRELPAMEESYAVLQENLPEQIGFSIVHGDYRIGNMLVAEGARGAAGWRIAAVLDWELCTLGDPLADLGYLLNNWAEPGDPPLPTARGAAMTPTSAPGFPSRAELLERYEAQSGRSAGHIDYYRAFQYWRSAAIIEGVLSRYLKGVMGRQADTDLFRVQVEGLAEAALQRIRELQAG